MAKTREAAVAEIGIDIGKNSFHVVGLDRCGAIVLSQAMPYHLMVVSDQNADHSNPQRCLGDCGHAAGGPATPQSLG